MSSFSRRSSFDDIADADFDCDAAAAWVDEGGEAGDGKRRRQEEEKEGGPQGRKAAAQLSDLIRCNAEMGALLDRLRPKIVSSARKESAEGGDAGGGSMDHFMVLDILVQRCVEFGTEVLLIGRAHDGGSVCARVCGWKPYLYIRAPRGWMDTRQHLSCLKDLLNEKIDTYMDHHGRKSLHCSAKRFKPSNGTEQQQRRGKKSKFAGASPLSSYIQRITTTYAKSIYGYTPDDLSMFLKIEVMTPYLVRTLCDIFSGYVVMGDGENGKAGGDDAGAKGKAPPAKIVMRGVALEMHPLTHEVILLEGKTETFNSNIDAVQQFMVDTGLVGCQWVRIVPPSGAALGMNDGDGEDDELCSREREMQRRPCLDDRKSSCTREWHITLPELELLDVDAAPELAPLRILSFDLEAAGRRGVFPQASEDPVIQIGIHFQVLGGGGQRKAGDGEDDGATAEDTDEDERGRKRPVLLSLRTCDPIEGADVISFDSEDLMLRAFRDIIVAFDVDVFTGYNILNFDFPYLHDRAAALSGAIPRPEKYVRLTPSESDDTASSALVTHFDNMTRVRGDLLQLRETEYVSAQTGKRKRTKVTIFGRVCLDMLVAIQNSQHRLEQYKLDAVAEYFLGDKKVDVPFTQITPMWRAGPKERRELGVYCLKDAQLPLDLNAKIDALTQTVEMARSTGILPGAVSQRGVMVRNTSLLLRRARERGLLFPNLHAFQNKAQAGSSEEEAGGRKQRYTGATVLDPTCGIHRYVGVLDFSAMYPSIIRAHNLCYSTIVLNPAHMPGADPDGGTHKKGRKKGGGGTELRDLELLRVCGHTFVPEAYFKGLIPEVVEHLQNCRNKAKRAYAEATDPMAKQVCKARELAFKIAGNGVYGALGSTLSLLPLLAIAESVTAIGRMDILKVKQMAEDMYPDGQVVYGDTDSVFVRMPLPPEVEAVTIDGVRQASEMSVALAERVNLCLKHPKKIEFEKVFETMVLLSKKRYAGTKYEAGFKFGVAKPSLDVKGLQSVRRDGSPLVRDLVRDVLQSILESGSETDAAAIVRRRLLDVMEDKVPLEGYAIKKTLRKAMHDCCHPMRDGELRGIRRQLAQHQHQHPNPNQGSGSIQEAWDEADSRPASIGDAEDRARISATACKVQSAGKPEPSPAAPPQQSSQAQLPLTYAEQDQAIYAKIPLPWRPRVRLPHVLLAWRLRLVDPGSAPVPGESIQYVVTNNGGSKCFEKVETLDSVRTKHIPVDRRYYINSLRVPIDRIFIPIIIQRIASDDTEKKKKRTQSELNKLAEHKVDVLIWSVMRGHRWTEDTARRRAAIAASPIAMAFARQAEK